MRQYHITKLHSETLKQKCNSTTQLEGTVKRSETVPHNRAIPETPPEWTSNGEQRQVLRLVKCPIIRRKSSGQRHLSECDDEIHYPEQHEQLKELQIDRETVQHGEHRVRTLDATYGIVTISNIKFKFNFNIFSKNSLVSAVFEKMANFSASVVPLKQNQNQNQPIKYLSSHSSLS